MKWKIKRMILSMPIVLLPLFLTVACSSQVPEDKNNNKQKLVKEAKEQFMDSYKTSRRNFYPYKWVQNTSLQYRELGISFMPHFEYPIKISYFVENVDLNLGTVYIRAEIFYENQFADQTSFKIIGFRTTTEEQEDEINTFLGNIDNILKAPDSEIMARHFEIDESFFNISEKYLKQINFKINRDEIRIDDYEGTLAVQVIAEKKGIKKTKSVLIKGFKTFEKLINDIKDFLKNFSKDQPLDFEEKITADATWNTVLYRFIDKIKIKFGKKVTEMFSWKILNEKNHLWGADNLNLTPNTMIDFTLKNETKLNHSNWTNVYFKNIKLSDQEKEIYNFKNRLETIFKRPIESNYFKTKEIKIVKNELQTKPKWEINDLENLLGIKIEEEIKNNVTIFGTLHGIIDNKDNLPYQRIAINIEIKKGDLNVKINQQLWVTFEN